MNPMCPIMSCRQAAFCAAILFSFLGERAASADPSISDKAAAETLFVEGRKAMSAGKFTEACKSFSDSQRLDPGVGTLLNLGRCYEKLGKTASAWTTYREAASAARVSKQPAREKNARAAAEALEAKLAKLIVQVTSPEKTPRLQIVRDGENVAQSLWGVAAAVDPGAHEIEALAPGFKPWRTRISAEAGKSVTIVVPTLEAAPVVVAARAQPASSGEASTAPVVATATVDPLSQTDSINAQRVIGFVAIGAGAVSAGIGGYFGLKAKSTYDSSYGDGRCEPRPSTACTRAGLDIQDHSLKQATISTVTMVAGGVAAAAGVVLLLTAPSHATSDAPSNPAQATKPRVWVSASPIGDTKLVTLSGAF